MQRILKSSEELREYLVEEFHKRKTQNPRYSVRAYAHALKIHNATLSQILTGKRVVGPATIQQISKYLSVQIEPSSFSRRVRGQKTKFRKFDPSVTQKLSDWYAWVLLELIALPDFKTDAKWIAKRLGTPVSECERVIELLQKSGILKIQENGWEDQAQDVSLITPEYLSFDSLKDLQRQFISRSLAAMDSVEPTHQNHSCLMLNANPEDIPELKEKIKKFRREISRFLKQSKRPKTEVYALQLSCFPLTCEAK